MKASIGQKVLEMVQVKELKFANPKDLQATGLERFPPGFSMPRFPAYSGKGCPASHITQFVTVLTANTESNCPSVPDYTRRGGHQLV